MSDTPETDALESENAEQIGHPVWGVARQLERERNEWIGCADRLYNASGWHDQWPMAVAHYKKLKKKYE